LAESWPTCGERHTPPETKADDDDPRRAALTASVWYELRPFSPNRPRHDMALSCHAYTPVVPLSSNMKRIILVVHAGG
jgi:hypothetical protein